MPKVQYFLRIADKRRDEKNFEAELDALKEAEGIAIETKDFNLKEQIETHMAEFEKAKWLRNESEGERSGTNSERRSGTNSGEEAERIAREKRNE